MSFFGLEQNIDLENEKRRFLQDGRQEDVAVYTWGEAGYDGLGDALQEGGDEFNDETFGAAGDVGVSPSPPPSPYPVPRQIPFPRQGLRFLRRCPARASTVRAVSARHPAPGRSVAAAPVACSPQAADSVACRISYGPHSRLTVAILMFRTQRMHPSWTRYGPTSPPSPSSLAATDLVGQSINLHLRAPETPLSPANTDRSPTSPPVSSSALTCTRVCGRWRRSRRR